MPESSSAKGNPSHLSQALEQIRSVGAAYSDQGLLRALIRTVGGPEAAVTDALLNSLSQRMARKIDERQRTFFDELAKGTRKLTEEDIQRDDFLHAFMITVNVVRRTEREEKLLLLARLLRNYYPGARMQDLNEYEETLRILDDLSVRELHVLTTLVRMEEQHADENASRKQTNPNAQGVHWSAFHQALETKLQIAPDEIMGILARLTRTGLYRSFTATSFSQQFEEGSTTANFTRFRQVLDLDTMPIF